MSGEMAQKVIVPKKENYVPKFLKQRDIGNFMYAVEGKINLFQSILCYYILFYSQLCAGGAPGQTYGCIRSAVSWGCIPPPPLLAWGGENLLHLSSPVKETVQQIRVEKFC